MPRARTVTYRWRSLAAVACVAQLIVGCRKPLPQPNIVLVVVDTARADHWSCYGYPRPTTPHIDAFAAEAIRFASAYSVSTWTLPAHASLFTGVYPVSHGATQEHLQLDDGVPTLAHLLRARGYATAAFSGNPWVSRTTHLDRGFDVMQEMWGRPDAREDGAVPHATNRMIFEWLRQRPRQRPFFMFVNYIEPHFPYEAPQQYQERFVPADVTPEERAQATVRWVDWYLHPEPFPPRVAALRAALYDAEIAYADGIVAELLEGLKHAGAYEDSLIVVTSDHGENLGDHGHLDHVFSLYNSTVHVPLLIRRPQGRQGGSLRDDPVQLTDVFSTLAAAAGISTSGGEYVGRDLLAGAAPADRPILSEYGYPAQALQVYAPAQRDDPALNRFRRRLRAIQVGTRKLVWGSDGRDELYDLAEDPAETHNLIGERAGMAEELRSRLQAMCAALQAAAVSPVPSPSLDAATQERLRALGYLR